MRCAVCLCAILFATAVDAADDFRVMKLEQDVRTLERQLQSLQRQLDDLQRQLRNDQPAIELRSSPADDAMNEKWLSAATWNRIRRGMSELEVIELLGKPTALRPDAQGRSALLYTMEIGTTGFLSGSVSFDAGKVVDVQVPTLR
jgi:hypothetical protein